MYFTDVRSGSLVRFELSSIVCPDREQVLARMSNRLSLTGKVVQLSDAGEKSDYYAIIQVGGVMSPLIVPVDQVELCHSSSEDEALT